MPRACALRTLLLSSFVFPLCLATPAPSWSETTADSAAAAADLDARLTQLQSESNPRERHLHLIRLGIALRDGVVRIRDPQAGERLARTMADIMEHDPDGMMRWVAADFLADNAHPAAADALLRVVTKVVKAHQALDRSDSLAAHYAKGALLALGEKRLIPLLLLESDGPRRPGSWGIYNQLAILGHRAGRDSLLAFLHDEHVETEYEISLAADPRLQAKGPEEIKRRAKSDAEKDRKAADRAVRDLDLLANAGLKVPFSLDDHAIWMIKKNGFVILPEAENEMFLYYSGTYPFITADAVFHAFMSLVRSTLDDMERLVLRPRVRDFSASMFDGSIAQARDVRDKALQSVARRNAAFFAVPVVLLGDSVASVAALNRLPKDLREAVGAEVDKIRAHDGIHRSSLFDIDEDFTKYRPRGRHSSSPEAEAYFQAMLYYGRTVFRLSSQDETRQALMLSDLVTQNESFMAQWSAIDSILGRLFGERDDLTIPDYIRGTRAQGDTLDSPPDLIAVAREAELLSQFCSNATQLYMPRVNTAYLPRPESSGWKGATRGLRVFGQRYSRPMHVFQAEMDAGTWPVSGLDVASKLLGSRRAESLRPVSRVRPESLDASLRPPLDPYSSLMDGYLHCARSLFDVDRRSPAYMQQAPWEERLINTALGGWAEVQHSTALYAKDANTYSCASAMIDRVHGYVDPSPVFFDRLDTLAYRLVEFGDSFGLFQRIADELAADSARVITPHGSSKSLDDYRADVEKAEWRRRADRKMFEEFSTMLRSLSSIAEKELRGEGQSIDDGLFLKGFDRRFAHFAFHGTPSVAPQSMALITDPATEYFSGECLEVGVGRPRSIYISVPDGSRSVVCRGAIYSYTEFTQPIASRLDDSEWKAMSASNGNSGHPPWIAARAELGLVRRISRADLEKLKSDREGSEVNMSGGREPWNPSMPQSLAAPFAGALISRDDLDVLIEVVEQETLNSSTLEFALQSLSAFGDDPRVLACYEQQIERAGQEGKYWSNDVHIRLHNTIVGLGHCGSPALPVLRKAVDLVSVRCARNTRDLEHYQMVIMTAREAIAPE